MKFEYKPSLGILIVGVALCVLISLGLLNAAQDKKQLIIMGVEFSATQSLIFIYSFSSILLLAATLIGYSLYIINTSERYIKIDETGLEFPPFIWKKEYQKIPLENFVAIKPFTFKGQALIEFTHNEGKLTIQSRLFESGDKFNLFLDEVDKHFAEE